MTLHNTRRPYPYVGFFPRFYTLMIPPNRSSRKVTHKRINKYVDKPCPRFTTTGAPLFYWFLKVLTNAAFPWPWGADIFSSYLCLRLI